MGKIFCPYCDSTNTLAIVCNDTIPPRESTYKEKCNVIRLEKKEAILSNTNLHYSKEFDGKVVLRGTYNRYCTDCNKPFYYISNMIISDISILTFIIETKNERWKYVISFDPKNSYYDVDHNYLTKVNHSSLTPVKKYKLQEGLKNSDIFNWKPEYEKNRFDYKIKWRVNIEFYDGHIYDRGGYDTYPKKWNDFIEPFIKVFKNDIFKKMK